MKGALEGWAYRMACETKRKNRATDSELRDKVVLQKLFDYELLRGMAEG